MEKVYVGDVGTQLLLDCGQSLSGATDISLLVKKPDGTEAAWPAVVLNDQYLSYQVVEGDLDQSGQYTVQPMLTLGAWTGRGNTVKFLVHGEFC